MVEKTRTAREGTVTAPSPHATPKPLEILGWMRAEDCGDEGGGDCEERSGEQDAADGCAIGFFALRDPSVREEHAEQRDDRYRRRGFAEIVRLHELNDFHLSSA
jgi:hypothetical protein